MPFTPGASAFAVLAFLWPDDLIPSGNWGWRPVEDGIEQARADGRGSAGEYGVAAGREEPVAQVRGGADAVGQAHHPLGAAAAQLVVSGQCGGHVGLAGQYHGEGDRVLDRLAAALAEIRGHGVCGVAEQDGASRD